MPQNFLMCDCEQSFLMPPSLREWLAEDHLAWFVLDVVGELDLAAGRGRGGQHEGRGERLQHGEPDL
jgi:hypothetical protein